jgi:hypothetical protein
LITIEIEDIIDFHTLLDKFLAEFSSFKCTMSSDHFFSGIFNSPTDEFFWRSGENHAGRLLQIRKIMWKDYVSKFMIPEKLFQDNWYPDVWLPYCLMGSASEISGDNPMNPISDFVPASDPSTQISRLAEVSNKSTRILVLFYSLRLGVAFFNDVSGLSQISRRLISC